VKRAAPVFLLMLIASCGGHPAAPRDPTSEPAYRKAVADLNQMNRNAEKFFAAGQRDDAAALIEKAQPLEKRVLDVPRPSLEAVEAASDLDDLYGRMLLTNRHYAWARLMFQKNLNRWKHWAPKTEETERRYKLAESEIAECDKHIGE
jgi:hypothetical protein